MMKYTANDIARFWSKVDKSGGPDACWPWIGNTNYRGYGRFAARKADLRCHRVVWELVHGDIPNGLFVCHSCDNPACCNPAHLWLGTPKQNTEDMYQKHREGEYFKRQREKHTEIRSLYATGKYTYLRLAVMFHYSEYYIGQIVRNKQT